MSVDTASLKKDLISPIGRRGAPKLIAYLNQNGYVRRNYVLRIADQQERIADP
jgi:hypothetical protein